MPNSQYAYPFDPTGRAATNRIIGEQLIVIQPGDRLFHFTMLRFAPFYQEGLRLRIRDTSNNVRVLVEGVDYYLGHKFADASLATMHPIYGSIVFLNRNIFGTLIADYNTIGGMWTIDAQKITEIMMNTSINPRIATWEQVVERPIDFPVIDHLWNLDDMVGQKEILEAIERFHNTYVRALPELKNRSSRNKVDLTPYYTSLQVDQLLSSKLNTSGTATNSNKLGNKTLNQVMTDVGNSTVANSLKLENKNLNQIRQEILSGTINNSTRLDGKTLQEILSMLAAANGNANTLGGSTKEQIINEIRSLTTGNATRPALADNAIRFNGKTLPQVMNDIKTTIVDKAADSEKLDGMSKYELADFIKLELPYANILCPVKGVAIDNGSGGNQDPLFRYILLGTTNGPFLNGNQNAFDPNALTKNTNIALHLFADKCNWEFNIYFERNTNQSTNLRVYSDMDPYDDIYFGMNTQTTGNVIKTRLWLKYRISIGLREYLIGGRNEGIFEFSTEGDSYIKGHTHTLMNGTSWRQNDQNFEIINSNSSLNTLIVTINNLLNTPAI